MSKYTTARSVTPTWAVLACLLSLVAFSTGTLPSTRQHVSTHDSHSSTSIHTYSTSATPHTTRRASTIHENERAWALSHPCPNTTASHPWVAPCFYVSQIQRNNETNSTGSGTESNPFIYIAYAYQRLPSHGGSVLLSQGRYTVHGYDAIRDHAPTAGRQVVITGLGSADKVTIGPFTQDPYTMSFSGLNQIYISNITFVSLEQGVAFRPEPPKNNQPPTAPPTSLTLSHVNFMGCNQTLYVDSTYSDTVNITLADVSITNSATMIYSQGTIDLNGLMAVTMGGCTLTDNVVSPDTSLIRVKGVSSTSTSTLLLQDTSFQGNTGTMISQTGPVDVSFLSVQVTENRGYGSRVPASHQVAFSFVILDTSRLVFQDCVITRNIFVDNIFLFVIKSGNAPMLTKGSRAGLEPEPVPRPRAPAASQTTAPPTSSQSRGVYFTHCRVYDNPVILTYRPSMDIPRGPLTFVLESPNGVIKMDNCSFHSGNFIKDFTGPVRNVVTNMAGMIALTSSLFVVSVAQLVVSDCAFHYYASLPPSFAFPAFLLSTSVRMEIRSSTLDLDGYGFFISGYCGLYIMYDTIITSNKLYLNQSYSGTVLFMLSESAHVQMTETQLLTKNPPHLAATGFMVTQNSDLFVQNCSFQTGSAFLPIDGRSGTGGIIVSKSVFEPGAQARNVTAYPALMMSTLSTIFLEGCIFTGTYNDAVINVMHNGGDRGNGSFTIKSCVFHDITLENSNLLSGVISGPDYSAEPSDNPTTMVMRMDSLYFSNIHFATAPASNTSIATGCVIPIPAFNGAEIIYSISNVVAYNITKGHSLLCAGSSVTSPNLYVTLESVVHCPVTDAAGTVLNPTPSFYCAPGSRLQVNGSYHGTISPQCNLTTVTVPSIPLSTDANRMFLPINPFLCANHSLTYTLGNQRHFSNDSLPEIRRASISNGPGASLYSFLGSAFALTLQRSPSVRNALSQLALRFPVSSQRTLYFANGTQPVSGGVSSVLQIDTDPESNPLGFSPLLFEYNVELIPLSVSSDLGQPVVAPTTVTYETLSISPDKSAISVQKSPLSNTYLYLEALHLQVHVYTQTGRPPNHLGRGDTNLWSHMYLKISAGALDHASPSNDSSVIAVIDPTDGDSSTGVININTPSFVFNPMRRSGLMTLQFCTTPGTHLTLPTVTCGTGITVRVFWLGYLYIAGSVLLVVVIVLVNVFIYRRTRKRRAQLEKEMALLIKQDHVAVAHRAFIDRHNTSSEYPMLLHVEVSGGKNTSNTSGSNTSATGRSNVTLHVHPVCELPGHWHRVPWPSGVTKSSYTLTRDEYHTLLPYLCYLHRYIQQYGPDRESVLGSSVSEKGINLLVSPEMYRPHVVGEPSEPANDTEGPGSSSEGKSLLSEPDQLIEPSTSTTTPIITTAATFTATTTSTTTTSNPTTMSTPAGVYTVLQNNPALRQALASVLQLVHLPPGATFDETGDTGLESGYLYAHDDHGGGSGGSSGSSSSTHMGLQSRRSGFVCAAHVKEMKLQSVEHYHLHASVLSAMTPPPPALMRQVNESVAFRMLTIPVMQGLPVGSAAREIIQLVQRALARTRDGRTMAQHVTRINVVHNPLLEAAFAQRHRLMSMKARQGLGAEWPQESDPALALRQHSDRQLQRLRFTPDLDLVWHGAAGGEEQIMSICQLGFVSLAQLNNGWYGRGIYTTHYPQYSEYYASRGGKHHKETMFGERVLLLSWALLGKAFPLIERMDRATDSLNRFHGGYPGYDSHYVRTRPGGSPLRHAEDDDDINTGAASAEGSGSSDGLTIADEVVVWQEAQLLPRFIVYYKPPPSSSSSSSS